MPGFRCQPLEDLTRQLTFSPAAQRRRQLDRAEELYWQLEDEANYKLNHLIQRITRYKIDPTDEEITLVGKAVRDDLLLLVERLSVTLNDRPEDFDPPALNLDELARRWSVTRKTLSRYRQQGLFARKLVSPTGRRRLGFLIDSIERFEDRHAGSLQRAARFRRMDETERRSIIDRAHRLSGLTDAPDHRIIEQLAESTGRSVEAIRLLLRSHDEQAGKPVFPQHSAPLRPDQQQAIFIAYHRGESVAKLAEQYDRAHDAIYRAVNLRHAAALRRLPIDCVANPTFDLPDAESVILGSQPGPADEKDLSQAKERELHRVQAGDRLPHYLHRAIARPVLDAETERSLFVRLNYLKHLAHRERRALDRYRPRFADLDRIETHLRHAAALRHRLSRDYLKLVIVAAQKHTTADADAANEATLELIHLGHRTLLDAIEQFDVTRGNRFSAYANWRLLRAFAEERRWDKPALSLRSAPEPAVWPDVLSADLLTLRDAEQTQRMLETLLNPLSGPQRALVIAHLGIPQDGDQPQPPKTLAKAGHALDLHAATARRQEHEAQVALRRTAETMQIQLDHFLPSPAW